MMSGVCSDVGGVGYKVVQMYLLFWGTGCAWIPG